MRCLPSCLPPCGAGRGVRLDRAFGRGVRSGALAGGRCPAVRGPCRWRFCRRRATDPSPDVPAP
ncbi:MAG: hypothetical protein AVDCRST_MAG20-286 [uncultured Acidimicrobiales bacterium]|uniref:Uncharacterized protein n=1 Tax=uncultured Acidimicrobiales bacterium TaxID=310071 RepID=A0A6J4H3J6_9ACTN|nr:MAG: hypothetical protein AVDCRST_MAG20-286 [uncultured Acidimicrobiales bacterium]